MFLVACTSHYLLQSGRFVAGCFGGFLEWMPFLPTCGLWAASDLNLRNYCGCGTLPLPVAVRNVRLTGGCERHPSTLKVNLGTCPFLKIRVYQSRCFCGEGTHHKHRVEFLSSQHKRNQMLALYIQGSPVTPKGLSEVSLKSLHDTPGWNIDTLEPVSRIR